MPGRVDAILAIEHPTKFAIALSDHIYQLDVPGGFAALSEAEQTVYCVDGIEREVNNGGFSQFYVNSAGDQAHETLAALERIGAHQMAALLREANACFGPTGPSPDPETRARQMDAIGEQAEERWQALSERFFAYPDDLTTLMRAYVTSHRAEIRE